MKNKTELISYCGLVCQTCPIYWVSEEMDPNKKEKMVDKIVKVSKSTYNIDVAASDINGCGGCRGESSQLFTLCKDCKIRECAKEKKIDYCSYCTDFPCDKLGPLYKDDPAAYIRLDLIKTIL